MEDFYYKYQKGIRAYVAKKINDEDVVEELTHDILLAGYGGQKDFRGEANEFSWLCGIANHKIIDYYRKKKIKTILFSASPIFEEIADKALTPERDALKNELKEEIKQTFLDLNEGYEKILRLKYIDGLKIKEVAKVLKTSIKAVEAKLIRAKKKFRLAWNYDDNKKNRQDR
jgi:RNA polymerase sigma-70 factor, ECF subfamily